MTQYVTLEDAKHQPFWRRPVALLFLMALAMPIAFNTWSALLNNFVIEVAGFDGSDIGLLHTVREIPGNRYWGWYHWCCWGWRRR